ncbi:MAG: PEGA domain-containing protein [Methanolinea sp.]|jgi:hypothetical protein|nr:PEGA domain-containing protein [Methanolinea sp.]
MKWDFLLILGIVASLLVITPSVSGASTEVHIVLYAADGYTVLNETTVDYRWMEQHLPVRGDGTTHYYLQGPVFVDNAEKRWNPDEDTNVLDKDMGAVKGTDLRDLCELVGGMEPGDTVTLRASDGFSKVFAYENVYEPSARQGSMVITWYHANQSYVPGYADGMRLVFFADTSTNPWGVHAMGNYDWYESATEEYWYYYSQEGQLYPTTTGLSVKYISEIQIWSSREPQGSIEVTSDPAGARVYLDGVDTGYDTPCIMDELTVGSYSLTVRKNGYLTPEEQDAEVTAGMTVPISFKLEQSAQGGGDSGSGDGGIGGFIATTDQAPLSGGQLLGTEDLRVNGTVVLHPSATAPFMFRGGEEHLLTFDTNTFPPIHPALVRLYLFLDSSNADPGVDIRPQILVSAGTEEFAPIRSYSEEGDDDRLYATTLVYNLIKTNENGTLILSNRNGPSWNTTVVGALLLLGYEQEGAIETRAWICEGADLIGVIPGQETPMTMAEFSGDIPAVANGNASIITVTTPDSAEGNLSFYVNGMGMPARLIPGDSPVAVHEVSGFQGLIQAGVRLHIATNGLPVTNRVAVLLTSFEQPSRDLPDSVREGVTTGIQPTGTRIIGTPGPEPAHEEVVPGGAVPRSDPIGDFLCWLLNLILVLGGQPTEPCHPGRGSVVPVQDTTVSSEESSGLSGALSRIQVSSSPDGAMVILDNQFTGLVTPCGIDIMPGEIHSIRIAKDGYQPFEQNITGPAELEIILVPVPHLSEVFDTPAPAPARSHHGGIYIHSYPETAEIRIDGVVVGTSSPVLITPLKEGFHTIMAGIPAGTNSYSARQTVRTWVFPDAIVPVEFNLMNTVTASTITITGDSQAGVQFTVNGYYPVKRIPERVEVAGNPAFITLTNGSSYLSFTIPPSSLESGQFFIPSGDPLLCNLSIASVPDGAEIFLDGIRTGLLTPAIISNVSAGYHRISLTQRGRIPVTELILIAESQCLMGDHSVRYPLTWYPSGSLRLISEPPGAAVSFRGLKTGEITPCSLDNVPIGVWDVTLTQDKIKKGIDATVEPGKARTYSVVFD